jgi:hypothetical protein
MGPSGLAGGLATVPGFDRCSGRSRRKRGEGRGGLVDGLSDARGDAGRSKSARGAVMGAGLRRRRGRGCGLDRATIGGASAGGMDALDRADNRPGDAAGDVARRRRRGCRAVDAGGDVARRGRRGCRAVDAGGMSRVEAGGDVARSTPVGMSRVEAGGDVVPSALGTPARGQGSRRDGPGLSSTRGGESKAEPRARTRRGGARAMRSRERGLDTADIRRATRAGPPIQRGARARGRAP